MKLLVDMNLSPGWVDRLGRHGFEAVHWSTIGAATALGHTSIQQTQRYLNVTDEELRRGLEVSWNNKGRPLRLASGS